jgi:hypothetical protein
MSFLATNTNSSQAIQNALNSLTNTNGNISNIALANTNGYNTINTSSSNIFKAMPTFKMEMFKSENGGFVMTLITMNPNTYQDVSKLFILNDIQNMGRDIQNILASEILKY